MNRTRSTATAKAASKPPAGGDLSPRQNQILEMLRAGKVNKEIASELGIGLGTVKQHVVALFKKLDVSNRTMAVSRGMQIAAAQHQARPESSAVFAGDGILEYRPCVVLSVVLPETVSESLGRKMQQVLAAYAFDHDALFLARKAHAGDLIFGVQRATEQDIFLALRAARTVAREVTEGAEMADTLRGALTAGLAIASMNRTGGWSGEAIASIAIAQGRELAGLARTGSLTIAKSARELLAVWNPNSSGEPPERVLISELENFPWHPGTAEVAPLGREAELKQIEDSLARARLGEGSWIQIAGETGMGKSRLCRYIASQVVRSGGRVDHFVCRPDGVATNPFVTPQGACVGEEVLRSVMGETAAPKPHAVMVDDCHFLAAEQFESLSGLAAAANGKFVMLTGRRFAASTHKPTLALRLGRLDSSCIESLAAREMKQPTRLAKIESIIRRAAGVPLFAIELARHGKTDSLPLALRVLVGARMDGLKLDRAVLRKIARSRAALDVATIARELNEPRESINAAVTLAVASGVLTEDAKGKLRFTHPLMRQAVDCAGVE